MNPFQVMFIIVAGRTLYVRCNRLLKAINHKNNEAVKGELAILFLFLLIGIGLQYFHYSQNK